MLGMVKYGSDPSEGGGGVNQARQIPEAQGQPV